jgi:hypothetical protein
MGRIRRGEWESEAMGALEGRAAGQLHLVFWRIALAWRDFDE